MINRLMECDYFCLVSSVSHVCKTCICVWFQRDVIEDKEHEHSVTSKINLVDLAGSERQSLAQTTGDRLRVSASVPTRGTSQNLGQKILEHSIY